MSAKAAAMVEMYQVFKTYVRGTAALHDVSLKVKKGEFVYITGASGAGKSTLLKLLFCAERPTRGQVLVNGIKITGLRRREVPYLRRNIGFVFQDFKLLANATIFENVAFPLEVLGTRKKEIERRAWEALGWVGLADKAASSPPYLSGGEQQRAAIARALVSEPEIVLADEPTGNIDPKMTVEVIELFDKINSKGTTVLVATHDRHIIDAFPRRVLALEKGKLIHDGMDGHRLLFP